MYIRIYILYIHIMHALICIYIIYNIYMHIYIMKTMCLPDYHHNGFVATHALGQMMYGCAQLYELPQSHCGDNREVTLFS